MFARLSVHCAESIVATSAQGITKIQFAVRSRINLRPNLDKLRDVFLNSHVATLLFGALLFYENPSTFDDAPRPDEFSGENSRPIGMTMNAGPGKIINATPISRTVVQSQQ
jgi:hypothetical protein